MWCTMAWRGRARHCNSPLRSTSVVVHRSTPPSLPFRTTLSMVPRFVLLGSLAASIAAGNIACSRADSREVRSASGDVTRHDSVPRDSASPSVAPRQALAPNELGRIPVFEYHLIVDKNGLYERTQDGLRRDLETMYARGYRPISIAEMIDKKIDLPAGQSPVVLVFDDASPSQFRYIEKNGQLEIDPNSAVGIL